MTGPKGKMQRPRTGASDRNRRILLQPQQRPQITSSQPSRLTQSRCNQNAMTSDE